MNDTVELIQALVQQVVTVLKQSLNQGADLQATTALTGFDELCGAATIREVSGGGAGSIGGGESKHSFPVLARG
jgi:hypothetical protein